MLRSNETTFLRALRRQAHLSDVALLVSIPLVLVGVYGLPEATRAALVFETAAPTVTTAYTAHFVHMVGFHLVGNLSVYLLVAPLTYLLCVLADRRQLFVLTLLTLLVVFPFALSGMQLLFPRERTVFGFSGINAGFFGLLYVSLISYVNRTLSRRVEIEHAPALLFFSVGLIAWLSVPARGWQVEITAASVAIGLAYVVLAVRQAGLPTLAEFRAAIDRPGYFELAGAGSGAALAYPYIGFRDTLVPGGRIDVYIHLLGYCLAFISVFVFLVVDES